MTFWIGVIIGGGLLWFLFIKNTGPSAAFQSLWHTAQGALVANRPTLMSAKTWVVKHKSISMAAGFGVLMLILLLSMWIWGANQPQVVNLTWGENHLTDKCGNPVVVHVVPEHTELSSMRIEVVPALSRGTTLYVMGALKVGQTPEQCSLQIPLK